MSLDVQKISLTDDHTLETASEVMSQLQFDRRLPNGRQSYLELLKDLGFQSNQDGEEHTQFVFQGQCLILGDARVGKTSLKKSLVGETFDAEESRTKGVEVSSVDREWRKLDPEAGLTFGNFDRFGESVLCKSAMYGPGGIEFNFNREVTSVTSFLYTLMRVTCVILLICYLASSTIYTWGFRAYIIAVVLIPEFFLTILLHFVTSDHPGGGKIAVLRVIIPRFAVGFVTIFILMGMRGIDCNNLEYSFVEILNVSGRQFFWVAMICNRISVEMFALMAIYFERFKTWSEESSLPGQIKYNINSISIVRRIFFLMDSVFTGAGYGAVMLLTNMSLCQYCQTLHLIMIPILLLVFFRFTQTLCLWVNNNYWKGLILFFYIIVQKSAASLNLFYLYIAVFAAWACHTLYTYWDGMLFPLNNTGARKSSLTFIFIEKVTLNFQKLKSALCSKFSSLKLKLLDFSGDEEYYAYHHIFMREHALYVVVFNMANFVDDHFGNVRAKNQRLCFWLESICSKTAPKTPIFLVGTHRGNMDKSCLQRIDKHLQQHLLPSFIDELVMNKEDNLLYFPTENTLGRKDRGIQNLQKEIMSTAEEHNTTMGREIPYSWIKIQDAIINLRRDKNAKFCLTPWTKIKHAIINLWQNKKVKYCVTLQQFPLSLSDFFICTNWSKETLKYFHEKGLVIYTDQSQDSELSNWILLDPDVLVEIIIQLVTPRTDEEVLSQHVFRSDWKLLHDTGMLTESLLENILSRLPENGKAIKGFMEEYDIICPLFFNVKKKEEKAPVTHFVPSLLPMSDVNTPVWLDSPDDKKFYVFFHRFLPEPLFQHLLSRAHKNSKEEFSSGKPMICKDVGRFWMRPSQPYRLLQLKDEDMIEVTFNYRDPVHEMKPSDALAYIYGMISGICKRHFPYVKFHCGPLCLSDRCPGYQGDYVPHPGVQRVCSRRHVFNVIIPASSEAMTASFFCVNHNFKEQLKEWVV